MPAPTHDEVTLTINAPAETLYELVADLSRMGEWSPECQRCEWVRGGNPPDIGSEFRGHNKAGPARWTTTGRVVEAERGKVFAFSTFNKDREATRWTYRFNTEGASTVVTESYDVLYEPKLVELASRLLPRASQLRKGMERTLSQLRTAAEARTPG